MTLVTQIVRVIQPTFNPDRFYIYCGSSCRVTHVGASFLTFVGYRITHVTIYSEICCNLMSGDPCMALLMYRFTVKMSTPPIAAAPRRLNTFHSHRLSLANHHIYLNGLLKQDALSSRHGFILIC